MLNSHIVYIINTITNNTITNIIMNELMTQWAFGLQIEHCLSSLMLAANVKPLQLSELWKQQLWTAAPTNTVCLAADSMGLAAVALSLAAASLGWAAASLGQGFWKNSLAFLTAAQLALASSQIAMVTAYKITVFTKKWSFLRLHP